MFGSSIGQPCSDPLNNASELQPPLFSRAAGKNATKFARCGLTYVNSRNEEE